MASANLCSRVDDLYLLFKRTNGVEDAKQEVFSGAGGREPEEELDRHSAARHQAQNGAALKAATAELCRHPELKSYKLSQDDLHIIAKAFHVASTEYYTEFGFEELLRFLPKRQWSIIDKVDFMLSLVDREVLSFYSLPDADFHHDITSVIQSRYRLNGLLWNILLGKSPMKKAISHINCGIHKGDMIQDVVNEALTALSDYYPELGAGLRNARGIYYGKTVNMLLNKALNKLHKLKGNQPFKDLCDTCVPDRFWQKSLLMIYHYSRLKEDLAPSSLATLLATNAREYKDISSLLTSNNYLRQMKLLEEANSFFASNDLCLSEATIAKLTSSPASETDSIEDYLEHAEYFSLIKPEQNVQQLILAKETMQNVVSVLHRLNNPDRDLLQDWGLRGASLTDDKDVNHGCNILLHGPAGTGKTYIAGVIANELESPLLLINANNIRECYYGATEKRTRALFQEMRMLTEKYHPVFLLNEGDQLIHHRSEGVGTGAINAENSIQSIFLEELETFSGILVVTSNWVVNLDPAMSRRFHYKLLISAPDFEARLKLWNLHLPETIPGAKDIDLEELAADFHFTGGQIRNVVLNACHQASFREGSKVLTLSDLWQYACLEGDTNFESKAKQVGF